MDEPYDTNTVKAIAEAYTHEPAFTKRDQVMRDRRLLRNRRMPVNHPRIKESLAWYSPRLNQDIGLFARRLDAAALEISVSPKTYDDPAQIDANAVKQYWMRSYVQNNRRVLIPPSLKVLDRMAGDGVGWYRDRLDPKYVDRLQIRDGAVVGLSGEGGIPGVPFILETPDPLAMYYNPDLSQIVESGYAMALGDKVSGDTTGQAEATGRWVKVYRVIRLETNRYVYDLIFVTDKARAEEERFGVQPQIFGSPGYGPVPGLVTGSEDPSEAWQPLVVNLYPQVEQVNLYRTMLNNSADLTGAPLFYLKKGGNAQNPADWLIKASSDKLELKIDTGTGKVEVPEGYEPVALQLAVGIDLMRAIQELRTEMIDTGFPPILGTPQEFSARSGYDRREAQGAVSFYITPPLTNHGRAWYDIFVREAEAIKTLGVPVTVRTIHQKGERHLFAPVPTGTKAGEVTIKPEDFQDVDLEVGFTSETEASRIALEEEGMRMLAANLLSRTEFFEDYRGVDDVERAWQLIDRDRRREEAMDAAIAMFRASLATRLGETNVQGNTARAVRRRPPAGQATAGVGADLVQPGEMGTQPGPIG